MQRPSPGAVDGPAVFEPRMARQGIFQTIFHGIVYTILVWRFNLRLRRLSNFLVGVALTTRRKTYPS